MERRIPDTIQGPTGAPVLIVPDDQFDSLIPPVIQLPYCGYMDRQGHTFYEVNAKPWDFPQGFKKLMILFYMKKFYMGIPSKICEKCVSRNPADLIGGGFGTFFPEEKRVHLSFLGLRPRSELPDITEDFRNEAIFRFQEKFNQFVQWIGASCETTDSAIIPKVKMMALGYSPVPLAPMEHFRLVKSLFPASITGKSIHYEIRFQVEGASNSKGFICR